jgi:hypothetical protein
MHECVQVQLDKCKPDLTVQLGIRVYVDNTATRVHFKYRQRPLTPSTPHIDEFFPISELAPSSPSFHAWQSYDNDGSMDKSLPPYSEYADGGEAQPQNDDDGCTEEDQHDNATEDSQLTQIDTPVEEEHAGDDDVELEEDEDGNIVEVPQPTEQQHMTDDVAPSGWRKRKRP